MEKQTQTIEISYRLKGWEDGSFATTEIEVAKESVYTFTRALSAAEKYIQRKEGTWTVEDVVEFKIKFIT